MWNSAQSSASQPSPSSAISMVRLALLASVAWIAPPVSFHSSQQSIVPNASRLPAARDVGPVGEHPFHLGRAEIGIEQQSGSLAGPLAPWPAATSSAQRPAVRRSCQTRAVPKRLTGRLVPGDDGFALVGDADRGDGFARRPPRQPFRARRPGVLLPDFRSVMLDMAGLGIMLAQRSLGASGDGAVGSEQHGPRRSRAFVDDQDEVGHSPRRIRSCTMSKTAAWMRLVELDARDPFLDPADPALQRLDAGQRNPDRIVSFTRTGSSTLQPSGEKSSKLTRQRCSPVRRKSMSARSGTRSARRPWLSTAAPS